MIVPPKFNAFVHVQLTFYSPLKKKPHLFKYKFSNYHFCFLFLLKFTFHHTSFPNVLCSIGSINSEFVLRTENMMQMYVRMDISTNMVLHRNVEEHVDMQALVVVVFGMIVYLILLIISLGNQPLLFCHKCNNYHCENLLSRSVLFYIGL